MALPIAATPILEGKEAANFLNKIKADLKKPVTYKPTPKLGQVKELIKTYAAKGKK